MSGQKRGSHPHERMAQLRRREKWLRWLLVILVALTITGLCVGLSHMANV